MKWKINTFIKTISSIWHPDMDAFVGFFNYLRQILEESPDPKCDEEDDYSW